VTLKTAVDQLRTTLEALSNLNAPPTTAPESPTSSGAYPFVVVYPGSRRSTLESSGWGNAFTTVIIELHTSPADFPKNTTRTYQHIEAVDNAIFADPQLSSNVTGLEDSELNWTFGSDLDYIGVPTQGWRGELIIKQSATYS